MIKLPTESVLVNPDGTPNKPLLEEIYQAQELARFLDQMEIGDAAPGFDFGEVGYKPDPTDPDDGPFPGPGPWPFEILKADVLDRVDLAEQVQVFDVFDEIGG